MRVLVLSNGRLEKKEINNSLGELQAIVGGYIEMPYVSKVLSDNGIHIVINEEGKLLEGLRAEIVVANEDNLILDVIYGNCIFVGSNEEDFTDLTDEQIEVVKKMLGYGVYGKDEVRVIR